MSLTLVLRLGRLPVRLRLTGTSIYLKAMPPGEIRGAASKNETAIGKAEPFRTEGGRAAKAIHRTSANSLFYCGPKKLTHSHPVSPDK